MHKSSLRKLAILLPGMAAMAVCWALPALAVSEADVEAAVASQGKEVVSGNLFVWFLCAIAFLKVDAGRQGHPFGTDAGCGRPKRRSRGGRNVRFLRRAGWDGQLQAGDRHRRFHERQRWRGHFRHRRFFV